jgi:hypothetical protein
MLEEHVKPDRSDLVITILFLVLVFVLAVIGISRLKRSVQASSNARALADIRAVVSAETIYASANFGYFDDLPRLCNHGPGCEGIGIPGYPEDGPDFLDASLARRSPYVKAFSVREWIEVGRPESLPTEASATSVLDYCYRSTPDGFWLAGACSWLGNGVGVVAGNCGCPRTSTPFGEPVTCPIPPSTYFCE